MAKPEADRKERIIQSAIRLFIEQGAAFTRLSEVAKKAKVPAPLIHYYYKEVEALHYDVVSVILEELKDYNIREAMKHPDDPVRMMREYLKGPLLWARDNPGNLSIWFYFYYMASWSKPFQDLHTEIRKGGRDRISLMLFRGIEKGVFKLQKDQSVADAAHFIQSQITGELVMYGCEKKAHPPEYFIKNLERVVLDSLGVSLKS